MESRAVDERNDDEAIGAGLDLVAFVNTVANRRVGDLDAFPLEGDQPRHCLQCADGASARRLPSGAGVNIITILCSLIAAGHTTAPVPKPRSLASCRSGARHPNLSSVYDCFFGRGLHPRRS